MQPIQNMLTKASDTISDPGILRAVSIIGCMGWAMAMVVFVAGMDGPIDPDGHEVGGDFFHFYSAGQLVLEGRGENLYDMATQQGVQRRIIGDESFDRLAFYINPPTVATVMAPLAMLPYRVAFCLYSAAMLGAYLLAMHLLKPLLPSLHSQWTLVVAIGLLFYPVIRTITGGQNTAMSFLCLSGAYASLRRGRSGMAGVWLGILFFKAQLALSLCALLGLRRQWKCLACAAAVALLHYAVGAAVCGPWWPMNMMRVLDQYWPLEFAASGFSHISWMEVCEYTLPVAVERWIGYACVLATLSFIGRVWWRADMRHVSFAPVWACAICATLLISPHAQFYDAGLLVLAVLLIVDHERCAGRPISRRACVGLSVVFLLAPAYPVAKLIHFQPLILAPLLVFWWAWSCRSDHKPRPIAGDAESRILPMTT